MGTNILKGQKLKLCFSSGLCFVYEECDEFADVSALQGS